MANNRVYYAVHAVGFAGLGASGYLFASGVQSAGSNTNFVVDQAFQLGQLDIYANIEDLPQVELTVEKVLDGTAPLQQLATRDATSVTLAGRYGNNRTMVALAFYNDENLSASGVPLSVVSLSGMYVNSLNYTFPVDGNFTESITLVGNNKIWATGAKIGSGIFNFLPNQDNNDTAPTAINRRQHLIMSGCKFPLEIPGISASGTNDWYTTNKHRVHMQNITVSTDLGRTELNELGQKGPYHRFADFPVEVTCSIEILETEKSDFITADENAANNTSDQEIYLLTSDGTRIRLGNKNRLVSVSSTGGDTGGGNRSTSYNYRNFNSFTVKHPQDPVVALRP